MRHGDHWKRAAGAAGAILLSLPLTVGAFDAQPFSPAVDPQGYFSIYSSTTGPRNRYYLAAWYSHSDDTFGVQQTPSTERVELADRVDMFDLVGSYSLLDWLEVGLSVPISK